MQQMRLETQIRINCVSLQLPDIWGQGIPPPKSITPRIPDIPKGKGCACACLNSCSAPPRTMNTIQPLDSKTQIYNKHTIKLINEHIAKHQKQQERDSKSVWLQNSHSKINEQASKQINKARRWARKQERMYGIKTRMIPLTLCSSIDSIHWSLCSGSSALRYHRLSFTLMSKRHSSNSWGCTEGGEDTHTCVIRHSAWT